MDEVTLDELTQHGAKCECRDCLMRDARRYRWIREVYFGRFDERFDRGIDDAMRRITDHDLTLIRNARLDEEAKK